MSFVPLTSHETQFSVLFFFYIHMFETEGEKKTLPNGKKWGKKDVSILSFEKSW